MPALLQQWTLAAFRGLNSALVFWRAGGGGVCMQGGEKGARGDGHSVGHEEEPERHTAYDGG